MKLFIFLFSIFWLWSSTSLSAVNTTAVAVYARGYDSCLQANRLRYSNLALAERHYHFYTSQLNQAEQLDPQFSYTQDVELKNNLSYCERVAKNLTLAKAQNLMANGLIACFAAQQAANEQAMTAARQLWHKYQEQKNAAVKLNAILEKNSAVAHRIQQCDQVEKNIIAIEKNAEQFLQQQKAATNFFVEAGQSCLSARVILSNPQFKREDASVVSHALGMSERLAQQGRDTLAQIPEGALDSDQIKQAQQRQSTQQNCMGEITARLKSSPQAPPVNPVAASTPTFLRQQKNPLAAQLTQAFQTAIELCLTAHTLNSSASSDPVLREKADYFLSESSRIFSTAQKNLQMLRKKSGSTQALEKLVIHYNQCAETVQAEDTRSARR